MGHLDKLKVSNRVIAASHPRRRIETVEYKREKFIANIEEQIELVQLELAGQPLQLERKRGHNVVTVKPRLWWKGTPEGKVYTEIRYNKVALNIGGRGTSIEAGSVAKLPAIYRTVIRAVKSGELDNAIKNAVRKSRL